MHCTYHNVVSGWRSALICQRSCPYSRPLPGNLRSASTACTAIIKNTATPTADTSSGYGLPNSGSPSNILVTRYIASSPSRMLDSKNMCAHTKSASSSPDKLCSTSRRAGQADDFRGITRAFLKSSYESVDRVTATAGALPCPASSIGVIGGCVERGKSAIIARRVSPDRGCNHVR